MIHSITLDINFRVELVQDYPWTILPGNNVHAESNSMFIATSAAQSGNILRVGIIPAYPYWF